MTKLVLTSAAFVTAACVPASEEHPPAGAGGFELAPSSAGSGEPFVESSGWTVTIEKLQVQITISLQSANHDGSGPSYRAASGAFLVDARQRPVVFGTGARTGPTRVSGNFRGTPLPPIGVDDDIDEGRTIIGVDAADVARFDRAADDHPYAAGWAPPGYRTAPSLVLRVSGKRGDEVVILDIAFGQCAGRFGSMANGSSEDPEAIVEIREDALATAFLDVVAEEIFGHMKTFGAALAFENLAAADSDGDGNVTAGELAAAPVPGDTPAQTSAAYPTRSRTLLCALGQQAASVFRPRGRDQKRASSF